MDAPNPTRSDATTTPATADDDAAVDYSNLPPDIVADIHARLTHLDRLTVAAVFGAAGHSMNLEEPWLAIPGGETTTTAPAPPTKLYSISDRRAAAARAGEAAMRGCFFLGRSGDGWLVTADKRSRLRMVNPVTGAHRALPAITTCPFFYTTSWAGRGSHVNLTAGPFMRVRNGGGPPPPPPEQLIGTSLYTVTAGQVRQYVYRKVVLSAAAARPGSSYAAMLVLPPDLGAPMFATSDDPAWRVAPSRDGVEDAIHHRGRFYSVTYTGVVEEWDRGGGGFTSRTVATAPLKPDDLKNRKYIAAAPDGKLMVVVKFFKDIKYQTRGRDGYLRRTHTVTDKRVLFKLLVLDDEESGRWRKKEEEVGDAAAAALFVGANASMCVAATSGGDLAGGCIYFTDDSKDDDHWRYREDDREIVAGVYSLEKHRAHKLPLLQRRRRTPSYGHDHDDDDDNYDGNADADDNGGGGDDDGEDEEEVQIGKIWPPPVWFKRCTSATSSSS
ncbi:hypothetical protein OsI_14798 [Oryza sativa Indica Group]|uniref:KIB1-4 beta-propeller domain-containing protein n=1 Tax=Oryza sativa subsp. indica TaxID=39946 RepID=A2XQ89_ORYSI|nr:hypothetical protein OsI_14798 [Oryza sativa Indica Group]